MRIRKRGQTAEQARSETDEQRRKRKIRETLERHQGEDTDSQADALEHVLLAEPTQPTTDYIAEAIVVAFVIGILLGVILS